MRLVDRTALKNDGNGNIPHSYRFRPDLYVTTELGEELTNRYQQLIGVLRWSIELGRIDILKELSCLSQHLCYPREVRLDNVDNPLGVYKMTLKNHGYGHMPYSYISSLELDVTEELGRELANRYK